jgi:hypothetical protein
VIRLPVSGVEIVVRSPRGYDELVLAEARVLSVDVAVELLERVCTRPDGAAAGWGDLPYADAETALLHVRAQALGDRVNGEAECPQPACREPVDLSFSVAAYLEHHRPQTDAALARAEDGWYRVAPDVTPRFRVPLARDVAVARNSAQPRRELAARCIEGAADRRVIRRVERALMRLAPLCSDALGGVCPACGGAVQVWFDALAFALRELRTQAQAVLEDVDLLARSYHWSEDAILALPRSRRAAYAALARGDGYVA